MKKQPRGRKSGTDWESRFNCKREPVVKVLEKAFAGIPAGDRMLVVTPSLVDAAVAQIPSGTVIEAAILRRALAASHGADHTCPVTTGIALRVVAERAYLRMQEGADSFTPFWRALDPDSELAGKLACGREFLRRMRSAEKTEQRNSADSQ
ncbi:MAG: hypothetical protein ACK550_12145 [Synechococcaceae cyanobacterium]